MTPAPNKIQCAVGHDMHFKNIFFLSLFIYRSRFRNYKPNCPAARNVRRQGTGIEITHAFAHTRTQFTHTIQVYIRANFLLEKFTAGHTDERTRTTINI